MKDVIEAKRKHFFIKRYLNYSLISPKTGYITKTKKKRFL